MRLLNGNILTTLSWGDDSEEGTKTVLENADPQPHVTPKILPFVSDFSHLSARYIPPPETQKEVLADRSISRQWAVSGNSRWPQEDSYLSMPFLEQKERSAPELRKGLEVEEDAALGASLCL